MWALVLRVPYAKVYARIFWGKWHSIITYNLHNAILRI